MSTKLRKLYSRRDIEKSIKSNDRVRKYFSRKSERRKTVQVRISKEMHAKLKDLALTENMVLSFLLDDICEHFFKNY